MLVKLVDERTDLLYECTHVAVTHLLNNEGIDIEICYSSEPRRNVVINLPNDGHSIYMMNEEGDTVDSYRWPPKGSRDEI